MIDLTTWLARPYLLLLAPLIYWLIRQLLLKPSKQQDWYQLLPEGLAQRLISPASKTSATSRHRLSLQQLAVLLTLLFSLALAGVGYTLKIDQLPVALQELVIIQQLSPPERGQSASFQQLETSQRLVIPLLNGRTSGQTALIYYAGSAHLASPMTDDHTTLRQLFSLTHPSVMPLAGQAAEDAFRLAASTGRLAEGDMAGQLHWLWLTNQVPDEAGLQRLLRLLPAKAELHWVLLDTPMQRIIELRDKLQDTRLHLLHPEEAARWLPQLNTSDSGWMLKEADQLLFQELGHWLLLPGVLLLLWRHIRQLQVFFLLVGVGWLLSDPLQAAGWQNLDRQAWRALQRGDAKLALQQAQRPDLIAHALFQLEQYPAAAEAFELTLQLPLPDDPKKQAGVFFNSGTAWLFAGNINKAKNYLEQASALQPDWLDACKNLQLTLAIERGEPLPDEQQIQATCSGADQSSADASTTADESNEWRADRPNPCAGCDPLDAAQQQQLEQLQEDPWRLLRLKFQAELRERQP
ncbi:MAG: hypothetical protein IBX50_04270 [Marinospirillum sp.]|uniref:hypothetical protein n=1 Tax=Marinospirillum sp. TaxID=2183934 RepID=UPI0019E317F5|nr:hypothetical protein [Marinospirillum sp.]MBE0505922.1 hypothetical protein [Marinospirillum sp.]